MALLPFPPDALAPSEERHRAAALLDVVSGWSSAGRGRADDSGGGGRRNLATHGNGLMDRGFWIRMEKIEIQ